MATKPSAWNCAVASLAGMPCCVHGTSSIARDDDQAADASKCASADVHTRHMHIGRSGANAASVWAAAAVAGFTLRDTGHYVTSADPLDSTGPDLQGTLCSPNPLSTTCDCIQ